MSLNLGVILRESARRDPDKVALIVGDTRLTYGEVHTYAQKLAGSLMALGMTRGQRVALMLPNVPQFTIAYFAIHYVGGVVVPLNVLLKDDEIHYHLEDSDAVAWSSASKKTTAPSSTARTSRARSASAATT